MKHRSRIRATAVLVVLGALVVAGCSRPAGEFGFKTPFEDKYRKPSGTPEFMSSQEVQWVCVLEGIKTRSQIGIIYQKKEVVWVEVKNDSNFVDRQNLIIYGTIANLSPGQYRILITDVKNENRIIARKYFRIYADESEDEFL